MSVKIRNKTTLEEGTSGTFNTSSLYEILVYFKDWMDTDNPCDYDVFIVPTGTLMSFKEAFTNKHLIYDNHNICFFEPENEEDKQQGYTL